MHGFKRQAVLLALLAEMRKLGSWCGETHVQKCAYFLQEAFTVPLEIEFVLYKHGPFSFDFREVLGEMRGNLLIDVESRRPYGSSLLVTDSGRKLMERFPTTIEDSRRPIEIVAAELAPKKVAELERLGTALYVTLQNSRLPASDRAAEVIELKPHVSHNLAEEAVHKVDELLALANRYQSD